MDEQWNSYLRCSWEGWKYIVLLARRSPYYLLLTPDVEEFPIYARKRNFQLVLAFSFDISNVSDIFTSYVRVLKFFIQRGERMYNFNDIYENVLNELEKAITIHSKIFSNGFNNKMNVRTKSEDISFTGGKFIPTYF